jgi:hypothetical protein
VTPVEILRILQHLVVPEPQYAVPLAFQESSAACLPFRRGIMLAAIDLDDQFRLVANEVGDKPPDWNLTAKSEPSVCRDRSICQSSFSASVIWRRSLRARSWTS